MGEKECMGICMVMLVSGFSSMVFSLMMMIYLWCTRRRKKLEETHLIVQLAAVNLLTPLSIIMEPFKRSIYGHFDCQIGSLLTFSLIIATFGLKVTIFCARHQSMRYNLAQTNQNMTSISPRWVKFINVILWFFPIGIFISVAIYVGAEMLFFPRFQYILFPINHNNKTLEVVDDIILEQNVLLIVAYFLVIIVISILCNKVTQIHHQIHRNRGVIGFQQIHWELKLRNKLLCEIFLFVIWWAPCVILAIFHIISYALNQEPKEKDILIPLYLQALTSPSQGVVDFVLLLLGYPQISNTKKISKARYINRKESQPILTESNARSQNGSGSLESDIPSNHSFSFP